MQRHHRFMLGGAMMGFGLLAAVMASTEVRHASRETARSVQLNSTQAYGSAGLKASINQETGGLGAPEAAPLTPEEENALSTSSEGLIEVHHPDGSISMDLEGRFQTAVVAALDANGRPQIGCVSTPQEAKAVLGQRVAPSPAPEEK